MVYKKVYREDAGWLKNADIDVAAAIAKSKISSEEAWAITEIPSLPASKITSGIFALARIPTPLTGKDADTVDGKHAADLITVPAGSSHGDILIRNASGWVRLAAGTVNHFLQTKGPGANPTWTAVPGGGDMLKSVYDIDLNNIVDDSEKLEGSTKAQVQDHAPNVHDKAKHERDLIPAVSSDPGSPVNGDIWFNTTDGYIKIRINNVTRRLQHWSDIYGKPSTFTPSAHTYNKHNVGSARIEDGLDADKGSTGANQRLYFATDTGILYESRSGSWVEIARLESKTRLAQLLEKAHSSLTGVTANQHHPRSHDHSLAADGSPIAVSGVPNLPASKITSGVFNLARIPNMDDAHIPTAFLKDGSRVMTGPFDFQLRTSDPTKTEGRFWYRSDLNEIRIAISADEFKKICYQGYGQGESALFENGFLDMLEPGDMANTGNGSFSGTLTYGILDSGASLNNQHAAYAQWLPNYDIGHSVYDKKPQFEVYIRFTSVTAMNFWAIWGGSSNTPESTTEKKFGIKVINGALYAFSGDGVNQSTLDLSTSLSADTWYRIRVKRTSTGVLVIVDGTEKTEKTTNVPSGSADANSCIQLILKTTEAVQKRAFFRPPKILHGI